MKKIFFVSFLISLAICFATPRILNAISEDDWCNKDSQFTKSHVNVSTFDINENDYLVKVLIDEGKGLLYDWSQSEYYNGSSMDPYVIVRKNCSYNTIDYGDKTGKITILQCTDKLPIECNIEDKTYECTIKKVDVKNYDLIGLSFDAISLTGTKCSIMDYPVDLTKDISGDNDDDDDNDDNDDSDDTDNDGILNEADNCPDDANPDQVDSDLDGWGDACDNCKSVYSEDNVCSEVNPSVNPGKRGGGSCSLVMTTINSGMIQYLSVFLSLAIIRVMRRRKR